MIDLCLSRIILFTCALRHVNGGWIDPDTDDAFKSTAAFTLGDDREYALVFSDEFETEGRSLADGEDSRWTAIDKNDYTNDALHFYSSENVRTMNGVLNITTTLERNDYKAFDEDTKKFYLDTKHVQSGMVQGWNKFCLTGGIVEFSAKLPGKASVGGLWPALWLLGNLARATYVGSADWVWPFSNDVCDIKKMKEQEISPCRKVSHYGMEAGIGRGAPEIDILEAMAGDNSTLPNTFIKRPYVSTSLQVAPGVSHNRPQLMHKPAKGKHWYTGMEYGNTTDLNPFFYGVTLLHTPKEYTYQSDAISANTQLDDSYYTKQNKYRVEWEPPTPGKQDGYVKWYINGKLLYGIFGDSLNITGTKIPNEPMYLLMNTAVAKSWGFPMPCPEGCDCKCYECGNPDCDCTLPTGYCDQFPAHFEVDYVRVWQAKNEPKHQLSCSTQDRPTELFIKGHRKRYMDDGDTEPLHSIRYGGGSCSSLLECGGEKRGICNTDGVCECHEGYSGSTCLSHFGFDDFKYSMDDNIIKVAPLLLPLHFVLILSLMVLGFLMFFTLSVIQRKRDDDSQRRMMAIQRSYHSTYAADTINHKETPISYCLIDGRMID